MVLKRLFTLRSRTRHHERNQHPHNDDDHDGSKASSRVTLDNSSCDSLAKFIPQHVGTETPDNGFSYYDRDDISSIHYGESVGSPPNHILEQQQIRDRYYSKAQHLKLLKSLRSTEELNYLVPSTSTTLKVIDCVDKGYGGGVSEETSTIGGEGPSADDGDNINFFLNELDQSLQVPAQPKDLNGFSKALMLAEDTIPIQDEGKSPVQKLREELGIDDDVPSNNRCNDNHVGVVPSTTTHNDGPAATFDDGGSHIGVGAFSKLASTKFSLFCVSLLSDNHYADGGSNPIDSVNRAVSSNVNSKKPISECVVRESLKHHLEVSLLALSEEKDSMDVSDDDIKQLLAKDGVDSDEIEDIARKLITVCKYDEAIQLYKKVLDRQQIFPDAETRAETYSKISILHLCRGDMARALGYSKKSLKMNREESRQAQSATSLLSVGLAYMGANRLDSALMAWKQSFQTSCQVFGYDHPFVAILLNNIGCLHYLKGDLPASVKTLSESLDMQRRFLRSSVGMNSDLLLLDIAVTTGNIARIATKNGDLDTASALFEEVISLQESVLDDRDHPLIQTTNNAIKNISVDFRNHVPESFPDVDVTTRKPTGATTKTESMSVTIKTNGTSEVVLSAVDKELVNGAKLSIFGNSDGIPMRRVGAKSPLDAMDDTDNLDVIMLGSLQFEYTPRQRIRSTVLHWFGKSIEEDDDTKLPAVPFDKTPRKRIRIPVDMDHDNVVDAELYLPGIIEQTTEHLEHKEVDEALELFESVLASHKDKYGDIHHLVGSASHNIGVVHMFAERYARAMKYFHEAMTVRRAALGMDHPDVAASMMKIGMIQLARRDSEQARDTFLRVLAILRKVLGYGHIQVARLLNNLAVAQYDLGAYLDAFRTFQQAHEIQRRLFLLSQVENTTILNQTRIIELALANTLNNLGFMYCRQKKFVDSLRMLQEASKMRSRHLGEHHPAIVHGEENLRFVREKVTEDFVKEGRKGTEKKKENTLDMLCGAAGNS